MSEHHMIEAIHDLRRTVWRSMMVSSAVSALLAIAVCTALNYLHTIELLQQIQAIRPAAYSHSRDEDEHPTL